jgi:hypothetical protein
MQPEPALAQSHSFDFNEVTRAEEIRPLLWNEERSRADFSLGQAKRYEREEAVFLKKESYFKIGRRGKRLEMTRLNRDVVLIQDKNALTDFSILELNAKRGLGNYADVGVRIFKVDGRVLLLTQEEFITSENGIKAALPDLEIGDIIDFYSYELRTFLVKDFLLFEPDEDFLISGYPVLQYHSEFLLGEDAYMKFAPMNHAPVPRIKFEQKKGSKVVCRAIIEEEDIVPEIIEQRWAFIYRELPVIRYILAIADSDDEDLVKKLIANDVNLTIGTETSQIQKMLEGFLKEDSKIEPLTIKEFMALQVSVQEKELTTDGERVEEFYESLCHYIRSEKCWSNEDMDSWAIVRVLAAYCREEGIPSSWVYAMPAYLGSMEDILVSDDLHHLLRIELEEKPLLMDRGDIFLPLGYYPSYEEGGEAFVVPNSNVRVEEFNVDRWVIPYSLAVENGNTAILDLEILEEAMKGEIRISSKGHESTGLTRNCDGGALDCEKLASFLPSQENIIREGRRGDELYGMDELRFLVRRDPEVLMETEASSPYKALGAFSNWMIGTVDDELKGRFRQIALEEIQSVQLLSDGLDPIDKDFTYSTSITLSDVFTEVGDDRLLFIGPLIGSQVDIPESEYGRKSDIRMPCARTYTTEMNIRIPSGYSVEGMSDLEGIVDNEAGAFVSQAYMSGKVLCIRTSKTYKRAFDKAENWPLMLEFLEAAYDFSKKKVLLKKLDSLAIPE